MGLAGYFWPSMHLGPFVFADMDCNGILLWVALHSGVAIVEDPVWLRIVVKILFWAMFVLLAYAIDYFVRAKGESRKGFRSALMWGTGMWAADQLFGYFDLV